MKYIPIASILFLLLFSFITTGDKLKTITIHKLPYSKELQAKVKDMNGKRTVNYIRVTEGKSLQLSAPGISEISFESDGKNPVSIIFKDKKEAKGVWLNAFELTLHKNTF